MATSTATLAVEIGGSNTRVGLRRANGELSDFINIPTGALKGELLKAHSQSGEGDHGIATLAELQRGSGMATRHAIDLLSKILQQSQALQELEGVEVTAVGIGVAGNIDGNGVLVYAPNLGWPKLDLAKIFTDKLGIPAVAENDATAAVIAESHAAAVAEVLDQSGPNSERLVYGVTLGTGIGSALTRKGEVVRGAQDDAFRFGHLPVVAETKLHPERTRACACGRDDCHRMYLAGEGLVLTLREMVEDRSAEPDAVALRERYGAGLPGIDATEIRDLALAGNKVARESFDVLGRQFGAGLYRYVKLGGPQPHVVSVGGGLGTEMTGDWIREAAVHGMEEMAVSNRGEVMPAIMPMAYGEQAGLHGVAIKAELMLRAQAEQVELAEFRRTRAAARETDVTAARRPGMPR